ncbi:hypothetical protein M0805_003670 [Coniferiporia weirii]|nr:hypothetical protein M0805_003670 [Coniferiporia weirii]
MNVLSIGGSRNIGYFAAQRLLKKGATVTFLLRNPSCFDTDETIKPYIASGKARIVSGDALKEEDNRRAWELASEGGDSGVDVVLFTVGGLPKLSITKGIVLDPKDICTRSMLNLLATFPRGSSAQKQPRLICISSTGLGRTAHAALPLLLKPMYGYLLDGPHKDKLGMERAVSRAAGWTWPAADGEPDTKILPPGWETRVGKEGWLTHAVVVRPALLTDGACVGDKRSSAGYRASEVEMRSAYTVSRQDVAHFIVEQALADWSRWEGKCVRVAY